MPSETPKFAESLSSALAALIELLPRHGADYALIGGLAAGLRGRMRFTDDIDFIVKIAQIRLPGLLDALADGGFALNTTSVIREWNEHHFVAFYFQDVRIDWVKPLIPAYQHVLDKVTDEEWQGRKIRVASVEGLILMKVIASREQDVADVCNLLAANRNQLDLAWVEREWLTLFDLKDPRWVRYQQAIADYYQYPRHG